MSAGSAVRDLPDKTHHKSENPNILTTRYVVVPHERDLRSFAPRPGAAVVDRSGLGPHRHPLHAPKPAWPQERSARQGGATKKATRGGDPTWPWCRAGFVATFEPFDHETPGSFPTALGLRSRAKCAAGAVERQLPHGVKASILDCRRLETSGAKVSRLSPYGALSFACGSSGSGVASQSWLYATSQWPSRLNAR